LDAKKIKVDTRESSKNMLITIYASSLSFNEKSINTENTILKENLNK